MTLDLAKMPRGSANSKTCTLSLLDPTLPTIDMFKMARIKAWWPFECSVNAGRYVQAVRIAKLSTFIINIAQDEYLSLVSRRFYRNCNARYLRYIKSVRKFSLKWKLSIPFRVTRWKCVASITSIPRIYPFTSTSRLRLFFFYFLSEVFTKHWSRHMT